MAKLTEDERDAILVSLNEGMKGLTSDVKGLTSDMKEVKKELATKPDREEVRLMIKDELAPIKRELSLRPTKEEIGAVVREEVIRTMAAAFRMLSEENLQNK